MKMKSEEAREDRLSRQRTYDQNKAAAMTATDKEDANRKDRMNFMRRAFKAGFISQANLDAAEANDWRKTTAFPRGWVTNTQVNTSPQYHSITW